MSDPTDSRSQFGTGNRDCLFVEDNAAGHVLGALDPEEVVQIERHLDLCPPCRLHLQDLSATISYLAFTSPPANPSAIAKSRLLARIAAAPAPRPAITDVMAPLPRTLTIPSSAPEIAPVPASNRDRAASALPPVAPARGGKHVNWAVFAAPLAAVPLMLALAIVGGWAMRTQDRLQDQRTQVQSLQQANQELASQVQFLSSGAGGPTRQYAMEATNGAVGDGAGGQVVASVDDPLASLSVWKLPPSINRYRIEVETPDGLRHNAGEFTVDENGAGTTSIKIDQPLDAFRALRVVAAPSTEEGGATDAWDLHGVLWVDIDGNLGGPGGTEANNAIAN